MSLFKYNEGFWKRNANSEKLYNYKQESRNNGKETTEYSPLFLAFYDADVEILEKALSKDFTALLKEDLKEKENTKERAAFFNVLYANLRRSNNHSIAYIWIDKIQDIMTKEEKEAFVFSVALNSRQEYEHLKITVDKLGVDLSNSNFIENAINNYERDHVHSIGEYRISGKNRVSVIACVDYLIDQIKENERPSAIKAVESLFVSKEINEDFVHYSYLKKDKQMSTVFAEKMLQWSAKRKTKYPTILNEVLSSSCVSDEQISKFFLNSSALLENNLKALAEARPLFYKNIENFSVVLENIQQKGYSLTINDKVFNSFVENIEDYKGFVNILNATEKKCNLSPSPVMYAAIAKKIIPDFEQMKVHRDVIKSTLIAFLEKQTLLDSLSESEEQPTNKRRI